MRVTLLDEDEPLGSFVLVNGAIVIDAPEEGRFLFEDILGETLLALNEDFKVERREVTATSDPESWLRGLLLQYRSSRLRAALDDEQLAEQDDAADVPA